MFDDAREEIGEGPSLREITRRLTTPAQSGIVLTKMHLGRLGMDLSLPVGFGERNEMLLNLFRAAAELERLPELLGWLRIEAGRWDRRYMDWSEAYPASGTIWAEWRVRIAETQALLDGMAAAAMPRNTPEQHPSGGGSNRPCSRSPAPD